MSTEFKVRFDAGEPFAEGRFRYAFKGVFEQPRSKVGQIAVVKKFKDNYIWSRNGWNTTMKVYTRAVEYAKGFVGGDIEFNECLVGKVYKSVGNASSDKIKLNEYVISEEYLKGKFMKWCSNYGHVSYEALSIDSILTAFMHWTWAHSKGQEMVADVQGVKLSNGTYKLTDPAILSVNGEYGITDTSVEGMAMFFIIHQCTPVCSELPVPSLAQFGHMIPTSTLMQGLDLQNSSSGSTIYNHEVKFSPEIKHTIAKIFLAIASKFNS